MRLFIASSFPPAVLDDLNDRVAKFRTRLPSASWTRPESQHVTFAFLGEQKETLIEAIAPDLERAAASLPRFEAHLEGCGFFPNARRARVGWVGLEPHDAFQAMASAFREIVTRAGVTLDGGEFRPHLTLMRMREGWPPASIELFQSSLRSYRSAPFTLDGATLFSSQLLPSGAVHTPLRTFALA